MKSFQFQQQLLLILCLLSHVWTYASSSAIPTFCQTALNEVLNNYFAGIPAEEIDVALLPGGHSNICLLMTAHNAQYVLRIKKEPASIADLKRELFVMQESAQLSIAPHIYYVTGDYRTVLMEYIKADTLSLEQSKQPKNIIKIAQTLAIAHKIRPNPYPTASGTQGAVEIYNSIAHNTLIKHDLDQALELMLKYDGQLTKMNTHQATIHGDLNPRNIFLHDGRAIFIDWEYTGWENPFMDISYLAMRLDYTNQEEMLFLESYLEHVPTENEIQRYYLAKKLNYAQLTIFFFSFALREKEIEKCGWDTTTPLKEFA